MVITRAGPGSVSVVRDGIREFLMGRGLISSQTMLGSTTLTLLTLSVLILPVCWCTTLSTFPLTPVTVHCGSHFDVNVRGSLAFITTVSPCLMMPWLARSFNLRLLCFLASAVDVIASLSASLMSFKRWSVCMGLSILAMGRRARRA